MKILQINSTAGPNYWSVRRLNLIVVTLDLEEFEYKPTNKIRGFDNRLKKMFPGIYEHRCSEGFPGGFLKRVKEGTWMGHVVEHIAIELQVMAGMDVGFGRTRGTGKDGEYLVIFDYEVEEAGRMAAAMAVEIAKALAANRKYELQEALEKLREEACCNAPGPSTAAILAEARRRNIPHIKIDDGMYQLGYGSSQKRFGATITSGTNSLAVDVACNKKACKDLLTSVGVPMAKGDVTSDISDLKEITDRLGFPLAIKPVSGNHGRGVTTRIQSLDQARKAFVKAKEISADVMIEQFLVGDDYRLLVIDYKFVAAAKRIAAHVVGNGKSTIAELIAEVNKDPRRGSGHDKILTKIEINSQLVKGLKEKGCTLESVPGPGRVIKLCDAANLSKGGTAEDVTDLIHPEIKSMAERIARLVGLDICGIDIIAPSLSVSLPCSGGIVLEVNAAPGLRMHLAPSRGLPRNVASPILDMLFPGNANSRIPIFAVTGTNGKTTTTRLIAHILKKTGKRVGYTTTDGVYINNQRIFKGDCTGPKSSEAILRDPGVDIAVLECARGGLLRSGLAFDQCDVGVVTNVSNDHLGHKGIHSLEKMARVKSVIPESVHSRGYAVLNADDDLVYDMRKNLSGRYALFSMSYHNPRIKKHLGNGGIAAYLSGGYIVIQEGGKAYKIERVERIPLTLKGKAGFMIENILAAVLAAYTMEVSISDIRRALYSFIPSPHQTPGRMNIFNFSNFDVVIDYAHNAAGLKAIGKFLEESGYSYKTGIIAGIGDRRDEDIRELGEIGAAIFDEIIIREDADLRGRKPGELILLIREGVKKAGKKLKITAVPCEADSLKYAINNARKGSVIFHCTEKVDEMLNLTGKLESEEKATRKLPEAYEKSGPGKKIFI